MIYKEQLVMESHGDYQTVANIVIGRDILDNLVIRLGYYDEGCDYPSGTYYTAHEETTAILDKDEVKTLSRRLGVPVESVQEYLYEGFHVGEYIGRTSYVRASFKNMLDFILDHGAKYRLKRSSKRGRAMAG